MHPAYSVILFTTASGAGYGLLALLGLVGFNHGQASSLAFGLTAMVIALGLITVGLLSSTFHLGHPERAWRAFSQWRSSWLSREGVAAVITYVPALLFGLAWSGLIEAPGLIGPLGLLTAVMAMVTVFCTAKIYSTLTTIRAWNNRAHGAGLSRLLRWPRARRCWPPSPPSSAISRASSSSSPASCWR